MSLNRKSIARAVYKGRANSRYIIWDDNPVGLGLRLLPSGRQAYVLSYRVHGRKRLMTLGDQRLLSLSDARKRARQELLGIELQQADPLAERTLRALEARTTSIESLYRAYVADRRCKRPDTLLWYAERFVFPRFGSQPWRSIRRSEVRTWHASIQSPYNANRSLQALRAAIYWRLRQEDASPDSSTRRPDPSNPCTGIALRYERCRQVRLELVQLPDLERAIDAETRDPYLRAYFRFVLLTGCRRSEGLRIKWKDVIVLGANSSVRFRDTKGGDDRVVPLALLAVETLCALPRIEGNPHVFAGRRSGAHLQAPNKAWARIRARAGLVGLRIHDLRRSFGSWLGDAGFSSKQIGTVLGHRTEITSRVYMALGQATTRATVEAMEGLFRGARQQALVAKPE
jgi:integrase